MKSTRPSTPTSVTVFAFVGNLGCIRFPPPVRKASGIKRGDRLTVSTPAAGTILLERLPTAMPSDAVRVEGCACETVPEGCGGGVSDLVTVGWSYVQLNKDLATELGLLPNRALKLVAQPSQITVSLHPNRRDLEGVPKVACPP